MGCDHIQGYPISKSLPKLQFEQIAFNYISIPEKVRK